VVDCLFEVVAQQLVQLDEAGAVLFEPARITFVQLGPSRLWQRLVGGVSDQEVAEPEPVLAWDLRLVLLDQLLPHERRQARRHRRLFRRERLDGATVEDLALDRSTLEHGPLGALELVEARGEQRLEGRRDDDLVLRFRHRHDLVDEERVSARGSRDPVAHGTADAARNQPLNVLRVQRFEPERYRPRRPTVGQLGPRHTEEQDRRARRQERHVLNQVEKRLFARVDVVEDDHERLFRGGVLERLAEGPGDLFRWRYRVRFAQQRADRYGGDIVPR
jgi:hypothetical protein